ncbi:hypothetical protein CFP56_006016 [Quercus suber]|uniref:Uncharacterized protein n=1 Tax=Quercus suber TaxID=58331 RepID=A0AAW0M9L5_QUESU
MSETRPVPRRESPWGLPEGDNRQPKAHRCNDRAEDVIQLLEVSELILLLGFVVLFDWIVHFMSA